MSFAVIALSFTACEPAYRYLGMQDDNPMEESVEELIKHETGFDIDLTPSSPEK